ncbi:hypothetical protein FAM18132_01222 [Lacticaseibacillus paracasei]|nr:hypothetical protein FAM18132_01222 [Lacticaseibacillus paracasei]
MPDYPSNISRAQFALIQPGFRKLPQAYKTASL